MPEREGEIRGREICRERYMVTNIEVGASTSGYILKYCL